MPVLNGVLAGYDAAQVEARTRRRAWATAAPTTALAAVRMARLRARAAVSARERKPRAGASARRRAREVAFRVAYQADAHGRRLRGDLGGARARRSA